jgi:DnaJ family protein B protein 6
MHENSLQEEIKKAFRTVAQKCHPDVVGQGASPAQRSAAEAKFKDASAAYEVCVGLMRGKIEQFGLE